MTLAPTSIAAAQSIAPVAPCLRERVFQFIESRKSEGATIDETDEGTGIKTATVCGRFGELKKDDRIVLAGITRKTRSGHQADVYVTSGYKVKRDRRAVTMHVFKAAARGATRAEILGGLTAVHSADLDDRLRECMDFGLISQMAGELRQGEYVHHVTIRGLSALGVASAYWSVDGKWPNA